MRLVALHLRGTYLLGSVSGPWLVFVCFSWLLLVSRMGLLGLWGVRTSQRARRVRSPLCVMCGCVVEVVRGEFLIELAGEVFRRCVRDVNVGDAANFECGTLGGEPRFCRRIVKGLMNSTNDYLCQNTAVLLFIVRILQ